jgi:peptidyl-prolyl cis-trans isomerase D
MVLNIMRSRKFKQRALAILAVIFIPAFLFWGISGTLSNRQDVIGKINGDTILANEFAKSREAMKIQVILSNFTNYPAIQRILNNRELLNYMAWERLILLDEAQKKRIKITNQDVIGFISTHPLFQKNGVFDKNIYNTLLKDTLMVHPRDFEEYIRGNLAVQAVRKDILKDVNVQEEEIEEFYKKNFGKINCSYLIIGENVLDENIKITETDIEEYYELYKETFYDPARVEIEYIQATYSTPAEQRQIRKKLTSVYAKFLSGNDSFLQTAEKAGLTCKKPENFSREKLPESVPHSGEFLQTAFTLPEGEISSSIYSAPDNGTAYMIHKIKNYPRRYKSFDEVKNNIKKPALAMKRLKLSKQKAEEIYADMSVRGLSLEEAADSLDTEIKTAKGIGPEDYLENFGLAGELIYSMENAREGEPLHPVNSKKGVIIPRLDKRLPPDKEDLSEKHDRIKEVLLVKKQTKVFDDWFKAKEKKIKLEADLKEI